MKPRLKLHLSGSVEVLVPGIVAADFHRVGKPVTEWAKQHGFAPSLVYAVLNGRCKARRGKSHNIAVLLGLKNGVALASRRAK